MGPPPWRELSHLERGDGNACRLGALSLHEPDPLRAEAKRASAHHALYLTAVLTGMRLAELLGLRWQDVDKDLRARGVAEEALSKPLPRIRFHDLRHCHASHLALPGVPVKAAQERLGHSTGLLTLKVYTHTLAGQDQAAAKAVEGLLIGRETV